MACAPSGFVTRCVSRFRRSLQTAELNSAGRTDCQSVFRGRQAHASIPITGKGERREASAPSQPHIPLKL